MTALRALVLALVLAAAAPVAAAQQGLSSATWSAGPDGVGDNTYAGGIDAPPNGATLGIDRLVTLSGWFVDTTAQGWSGADDVQVVAGSLPSGASLGHGRLGLPRPDVAAALHNPYWSAAGWSIVIDPGALPLGQNTLSIYLHTPGKGAWFTQMSVTVAPTAGAVAGPPVGANPPVVTVSAPMEGERVSTHLGNYRISGTARDPVAGPKAIDRLQVWFNGERDTPGASFIGDADVNPDGTWELDFGPWRFPAMGSNLYVYVHSDVTNKTTLLVVHFFLDNRPL